MEAFDDAVSFLSKKLKKSAKQLVRENKDSETYMETKRRTYNIKRRTWILGNEFDLHTT